jgi:hypothetical protein
MVRVTSLHRQHPDSGGAGAARHKQLTGRTKPAYKVVLEEVTQQKKKLLTVVGNLR